MVYPPIRGIEFGAILAVLLELAKRFGLPTAWTAPITIVVGVAWTILVLVTEQFPEYGDWVEFVLKLVLLLGSLPAGAYLFYSSVIKPVMRKRWNK